MISAGEPLKESIISIEKQNYPDFEFYLKKTIPHLHGRNSLEDKFLNCSYNRNLIREIALKTNYNSFLFLDDDMIFPKNTIYSLINERKDIVGGWYPTIDNRKWVAGNWTADYIFSNYFTPQKTLTKVDVAGLGCCLIKRNVLEKIKFNAGINELVYNSYREQMYLGECGKFGLDARKLNFDIFMSPKVVCEHKQRI